MTLHWALEAMFLNDKTYWLFKLTKGEKQKTVDVAIASFLNAFQNKAEGKNNNKNKFLT